MVFVLNREVRVFKTTFSGLYWPFRVSICPSKSCYVLLKRRTLGRTWDKLVTVQCLRQGACPEAHFDGELATQPENAVGREPKGADRRRMHLLQSLLARHPTFPGETLIQWLSEWEHTGMTISAQWGPLCWAISPQSSTPHPRLAKTFLGLHCGLTGPPAQAHLLSLPFTATTEFSSNFCLSSCFQRTQTLTHRETSCVFS